jgi:hypothetical protein
MDLPMSVQAALLKSSSSSSHSKRKRESENPSIILPYLSKKRLKVNDKWFIISRISYFLGSNNLFIYSRKVPSFILNNIAKDFNISNETVRSLWKEFIDKGESCGGESSPDISPKISKGPPLKLTRSIEESIGTENFENKYSTTYRGLSNSLLWGRQKKNVPPSSLWRYMHKLMGFRDFKSRVKPLLSQRNRKKRLQYILDEIVEEPEGVFNFQGTIPHYFSTCNLVATVYIIYILIIDNMYI